MERLKHVGAGKGGGPAWDEREKVDFIETTALRQRRNGGREVTVTSRLHRQKDKDKERQKRKEIDVRRWPQEPES